MPDMSGKLELMHLVERLKLQKRTGWVREGCRDPESIADHMYRMAVMALLSEEDEELDVAKCVQMAVVHDLAEAEVGDITPFDGISKEEKQARETAAMHRITNTLLQPSGPAARRIDSLWHEYEAGQSREAMFVKDLDRLEMALQASEYESAQGSKRMQPFFESSIPKIAHPEVRSWASALMHQRQKAHSQDENYQHVSTSTDLDLTEPHPTTEELPSIVGTPGALIAVLDAHEEIFDLYTSLAAQPPADVADASNTTSMTSTSQSGLGFIDAKKTYVEISIDIPVRSKPRDPRDKKRHRTKLQQHHDTRMRDLEQKLHSFRHIQVEIQQDLGGLHHRAGDTGSVVWRASVEFSRFVLTQAFDETTNSFLNSHACRNGDVLELGSGTGVLALLLAPLFRSWTATDTESMLPLINKNVKRNADRAQLGNIKVEELDWTWSAKQFQRMFPPTDNRLCEYQAIFAVDCLFNEALVQPLIDTLDRISARSVFIISELRSETVLQLFLEKWLGVREGKDGSASWKWRIWRSCKHGDELQIDLDGVPHLEKLPLLGRKYVVWTAWRLSESGGHYEA